MDWTKYFSKKVLDRGYNYYLEGRITEIECENGVYFATVSGNYEYSVQIEPLMNGEYDMFCDCPHAQDGYNCKHMAAVLYHIESLNQNHSKNKNMIINQINQCDSKELIQFLSELLIEDYHLYQTFKKKFHLLTKEELLENIKHELNDINCKNHYYYDEREQYNFYMELITYMTKHFPVLMNQEEYSFLFELIQEISIKINKLFIYEKTNEYRRILNYILEFIDHLIEKVDDTFKEYIFNQLFELTQGNQLFYYKRDFIDYLYSRYNDESYIEVKKEIAKDKINEYVHSNIETCIYWLTKYINLHPNLEEIKEIILPHKTIKEIRHAYINYLYNQHYDQECLSFLEEDKENHGVIEYGILKEVYKRLENRNNYIDCLYHLICDYQGTIEIFIEYKNCFDENEWIDKREELFNHCRKNPNYGYFLVEEKLVDRLLGYITYMSDFNLVKQFEDILGNLYPNEIMELYEQEIDCILESPSNRDTYSCACQLIQKLTQFVGGHVKAQELISKYNQLYFRRSALKQELRKIRL